MYCIFPQGLRIIKVKVQVLTQLFDLRVGKGERERRYQCQQGVRNLNKLSNGNNMEKLRTLRAEQLYCIKYFIWSIMVFSAEQKYQCLLAKWKTVGS